MTNAKEILQGDNLLSLAVLENDRNERDVEEAYLNSRAETSQVVNYAPRVEFEFSFTSC